MTDSTTDTSGPAQAKPRRKRRAGGRGVSVLLFLVLVFQTTILPDTLGIRGAARYVNALALVVFIASAAMALTTGRAWRAPRLYVTAVLLIFIGCAINIARSLSPESLGAASALLPWSAALAIPFMRGLDVRRAWHVFYKFMLWGSVVSAIEYAAVMSGVLPTRAMETDRGVFLKGIFSTFFGFSDGTVHYRMYGLFAEPGTYAMFLLPVIMYAWMQGKRWPVALFLGCLYFTDSLGGFAALIVIAATYLFWRSTRRSVGLMITMVFAALIMYLAADALRTRYEEKGESATVRENNVMLLKENFIPIVTANPFGLPLTGHSLTQLENVSANYLGSNFEIYTVFVKGGIMASIGYILLLVWMLLRSVRFIFAGKVDASDLDPGTTVALVTLPAMLLFVFQRETILASALFAFLLARPLIRVGASAPAPVRKKRAA